MTHPTYAAFTTVSTCDLADALPRKQFMHHRIHALWQDMPRFAGRAFTVKCAPGDHLMVHAAIYAAAPGDVLVIQADAQFAVSGGNVCAIAQRRGITAFVVDGVIRDIDEVKTAQFPVHGVGVCPKPGAKKVFDPLEQPVTVGDVLVHTGDIIVADNDGVAVIPQAESATALDIAQKRHAKDAGQTLDEWQTAHHANVQAILATLSQ